MTIDLADGVTISAARVVGLGDGNSDEVFAEVSTNPSDARMLGLKNLDRTDWNATTPSNETRKIEPGRSIRLADGTKINFGIVAGAVREGSNGFELRLPGLPSLSLATGKRLAAGDILGMGGKRGPAMEVARNPNDPSILGLRNRTGVAWTAKLPDGNTRRIDIGRSVRLEKGTAIELGPLPIKLRIEGPSSGAKIPSKSPSKLLPALTAFLAANKRYVGYALAGIVACVVIVFAWQAVSPLLSSKRPSASGGTSSSFTPGPDLVPVDSATEEKDKQILKSLGL